MSLRTVLARPIEWLRAGYPREAAPYGYHPLIALMPASTTQDDTPLPRCEPSQQASNEVIRLRRG